MNKTKLFFEKQLLHVVLLLILLAGLAGLSRLDGFFQGDLWGISTRTWIYLAVASPIVHQWYVLFFWRMQLHCGLITRLFGPSGQRLYEIGFAILILSRVVLIALLAVSNRNTLPVNPLLLQGLGVLLAFPSVYLGYSVFRYFGYQRATGADHFEEKYRSMPIVKKGIFRFSNNSMYVFGFLVLWIPGLWTASVAALSVALFSHCYIWVHYFCTEEPDMRVIYGESTE